jgi:transposase
MPFYCGMDVSARACKVGVIDDALSLLVQEYEIGEITRFQNAREFSSYGRLVPGVAPSGPSNRRGRHAKQGSPHLTWAFGQAALSAVRSSPKIGRAFDRHLARPCGKGGQLIAYAISAHNLAQAVYHVLRDETVYRDARRFRA